MKIIFTMLVIVTIAGCDSTFSDLESINKSPEITFTFLNNELDVVEDSVKVTGSNLSPYTQSFTVNDPDDNLYGVYYVLTSGRGYALSQGKFTSEMLSSSFDGTYEIVFYPNGIGFNQLEIYAVDQLEERNKVTIDLTSFDNLKPVAALTVKPKRVLSRYEYTIDGSESYDLDHKYGGNIVSYEFNINSQIIELTEPKFDYQFGGENIYTIGLRVKDNNGVWSSKNEEIYVID